MCVFCDPEVRLAKMKEIDATMSNIDKADLCDSIREALSNDRWTTGSYMDMSGKMCLYGGGRKTQLGWVYTPTENALGIDETPEHVEARFVADHRTGLATGMDNVAAFNDSCERWEQVESFLIDRSKTLRELG
jgi:hypothetical protein